MEKLEPRDVEHGIVNEKGEIEIFTTKEWQLQDIAEKINEIIDFINKEQNNE